MSYLNFYRLKYRVEYLLAEYFETWLISCVEYSESRNNLRKDLHLFQSILLAGYSPVSHENKMDLYYGLDLKASGAFMERCQHVYVFACQQRLRKLLTQSLARPIVEDGKIQVFDEVGQDFGRYLYLRELTKR